LTPEAISKIPIGRTFFSALFLFLQAVAWSQDVVVKGMVFDKDSITPMQFAYVVNRNLSRGIVTDEKGNFTLRIHAGDTLCFSYVGYSLTKVFTHLLRDSVRNNSLSIKVFMKPKASDLKTVVVTDKSLTKEEKEYYSRKVDAYKRTTSNFLTTSVTGAGLSIDALYYTFSRKGKELKKLSFLYDSLMIQEIIESRLSPERIRSITGNDTLNVPSFLNRCFLPDQFVLSASDYDLFFAVNKYYKLYMEEKRRGQK